MPDNTLYYGDNLDILRRYVKDESVDLIYLDPPFNSNANYNVLFEDYRGSKSAAQLQAFKDTWSWPEAALTYEELTLEPTVIGDALRAFGGLLHKGGLLAYLTMMAPRLQELHRVLKPTGSIYLHCDPTASHYLKILMDAIFAPKNFRNEIIWRRTGAHVSPRKYGTIHDVILFYSKTSTYYFKATKQPYMKGHVKKRYTKDDQGRMKFTSGGNVLTGPGAGEGESSMSWRGFDPKAKNRHWAVPGFLASQMPEEFVKLSVLEKLEQLYQAGLIDITEGNAWPTPVRFLDNDGDGQPLSDLWAYQPYTEETVHGTDEGIDADVSWLGPTDPERLGYQTQKPLGLLERIIKSSCPENGLALDPFCGCGTATVAAEKLNRKWISIDITQAAIQTIKKRLSDTFGQSVNYKVLGEPVSLHDASKLAEEDPYQFQWWSLGLVGARPVEKKKGADHGIDGRLYFRIREGDKPHQIILSVKAGHTSVDHVRDLRGVLDREKADIGVLISMQKPTGPMKAEAGNAGSFPSPWGKHPKIQLITVEDLLDGRRLDTPPLTQTNITFSKAPKAKDKTAQQSGFDLGDLTEED